jgi:hypothetical protein
VPLTTFTLTISHVEGKSQYSPLLPVIVTAQLTNNSATTVSVWRTGLGVLDSALMEKPPRFPVKRPPRYCFIVGKADGVSTEVHLSDWVFWGSVSGEGRPPAPVLGPQENQTLDYCVGYGVPSLSESLVNRDTEYKQCFVVFPVPGIYRIQMKLPRLGLSGVESKALAVTIKKPENPQDVAAYEILSRSKWSAMFLTPFTERGDPQGIGNQALKSRLFPLSVEKKTSSPLDICKEILTRCPASAYAPYGQAFLAGAQALGFEACLEGISSEEFENPAVWSGGVRLLRQVAQDSRLPRRFREEALMDLRMASGFGSDRQAGPISVPLPSLEAILDGAKVNTGNYTARDAFGWALKVARRTDSSGTCELMLRKFFTPEQIETLTAIAPTDRQIVLAIEGAVTQDELLQYRQWARAELCKLPWRNPNSGELKANIAPNPW